MEMAQIEPAEADRLRAVRAAYARQVAAAAGIAPGGEIEAALAAIPREKFVGPPPWRIVSPRGRHESSSADPAMLYQDILVSLGGEPGLNNGQPSLHALCLEALNPKKGERAVHVGAGTGYYTAVLALLVGEMGRVDAYEIEPDLAGRARENLAGIKQAEVHGRSGAEDPLPGCDLIYVNAAAAEPLAVWLNSMRPEGRLLFPLAGDDGTGEMLLVTRRTDVEYAARFLCAVQFVPCFGAQDAEAARALHAAFRRGHLRQVTRLVRNSRPEGSCWLAGRGWWLG
jgi:protein-L-isoaspartate(D-aspartate) O-methyltransferase